MKPENVDVISRREAAQLVRRWRSSEITNYELEDRWPRHSSDPAIGIAGMLARSSGYSGGNWSTHYFYQADGNGNITYLVDSSQALAASYRYDSFGNTLSSSGTQASANAYRFSSKEINADSGMYCYGYRFYDPTLQRWLNRDPLGERGFEILQNIAVSSVGAMFAPWPPTDRRTREPNVMLLKSSTSKAAQQH